MPITMKAAKAEQPKELKSYEIACKAADDKKAWDIVTLEMEKNGYDVRHVEGYREGKWILIDAGEVIAHVFVEQDRQYYDLENLWCDAPRIAYEGE